NRIPNAHFRPDDFEQSAALTRGRPLAAMTHFRSSARAGSALPMAELLLQGDAYRQRAAVGAFESPGPGGTQWQIVASPTVRSAI
ncbi:MAG TPA: hypothetical protein VIK01_05405, partial [Polyangiaceae bacterium]